MIDPDVVGHEPRNEGQEDTPLVLEEVTRSEDMLGVLPQYGEVVVPSQLLFHPPNTHFAITDAFTWQ